MAISPTRLLWLAGTATLIFAVHTNWDIPLAAWLYPILLLRYTSLMPALQGILRTGLALLVGNVFWLAVTGMVFVPIAVAVFVLLSILLTVPFALDRLLAHRLGGITATLVFPASRVAMEYFFGSAVGFGSWGSLGVTQHGNLLIIQTAAVTGVYGVSFLIAWCASVCSRCWEHGFRWREIRPAMLVYISVLALVLGANGARLLFFRPTIHTVRVAGVGPSRPAEMASKDAIKAAVKQYWKPKMVSEADPARVRNAFSFVNEALLAATEREARAGAKIVLWPETQAKVLEQDLDGFLDRVARIARDENVYVDAAFALYTRREPNVRNVSVLITPQGTAAWIYDKAHPTPMEPMRPGSGSVPSADSSYGRLANVICYDADYPDLMRQAARKSADMMLVPADDWRGFEYLHAENVVFRAVENGYSIVRQASHGVSTAVDSQGRILASVNYFDTDDPAMIAQMPLQPRTSTIYSVIGDWFAWLCAAGTVALVIKSLLRNSAD